MFGTHSNAVTFTTSAQTGEGGEDGLLSLRGVVDSPCAIICYSDCSVCWVDAPAMAAKMIVDIKSDALKKGRELKLTGSTDVHVCINDMPIDRLASFLQLIYPEGRIAEPTVEAKTLSKTLSGTLHEVMEQMGFLAAAE